MSIFNFYHESKRSNVFNIAPPYLAFTMNNSASSSSSSSASTGSSQNTYSKKSASSSDPRSMTHEGDALGTIIGSSCSAPPMVMKQPLNHLSAAASSSHDGELQSLDSQMVVAQVRTPNNSNLNLLAPELIQNQLLATISNSSGPVQSPDHSSSSSSSFSSAGSAVSSGAYSLQAAGVSSGNSGVREITDVYALYVLASKHDTSAIDRLNDLSLAQGTLSQPEALHCLGLLYQHAFMNPEKAISYKAKATLEIRALYDLASQHNTSAIDRLNDLSLAQGALSQPEALHYLGLLYQHVFKNPEKANSYKAKEAKAIFEKARMCNDTSESFEDINQFLRQGDDYVEALATEISFHIAREPEISNQQASLNWFKQHIDKFLHKRSSDGGMLAAEVYRRLATCDNPKLRQEGIHALRAIAQAKKAGEASRYSYSALWALVEKKNCPYEDVRLESKNVLIDLHQSDRPGFGFGDLGGADAEYNINFYLKLTKIDPEDGDAIDKLLECAPGEMRRKDSMADVQRSVSIGLWFRPRYNAENAEIKGIYQLKEAMFEAEKKYREAEAKKENLDTAKDDVNKREQT